MNLAEDLISRISTQSVVVIDKTRYSIMGAALYSTVNFPDDMYVKVACEHHQGLLIIPAINQILFTTLLGTAEGISDNSVGDQEVTYLHTPFHVVNANDYQFVRKIIVGTPMEIEGECSFSDYEDDRKPATMLSLACISYTKKRADVIAKQIDSGKIQIQS